MTISDPDGNGGAGSSWDWFSCTIQKLAWQQFAAYLQCILSYLSRAEDPKGVESPPNTFGLGPIYFGDQMTAWI